MMKDGGDKQRIQNDTCSNATVDAGSQNAPFAKHYQSATQRWRTEPLEDSIRLPGPVKVGEHKGGDHDGGAESIGNDAHFHEIAVVPLEMKAKVAHLQQ